MVDTGAADHPEVAVAKKTNAVRLIERLGIEYELAHYELGLDEFTATAVAHLIGMDPAAVFKTLLVRGERHGPCFAVVAADRDLDTKSLARHHGERRMELVPLDQVEPLTGYRRGGVTAIGSRKQYPVYLADSAMDHGLIGVSAGVKGVQMKLSPIDYRTATSATVVNLER